MGKEYREKLTDEEWNAVSKLTGNTGVDQVFDICNNGDEADTFWDFEENMSLSLKEGLELLEDAIAYPLSHDGMTERETELIVNLFKEFDIVADYKWFAA